MESAEKRPLHHPRVTQSDRICRRSMQSHVYMGQATVLQIHIRQMLAITWVPRSYLCTADKYAYPSLKWCTNDMSSLGIRINNKCAKIEASLNSFLI